MSSIFPRAGRRREDMLKGKKYWCVGGWAVFILIKLAPGKIKYSEKNYSFFANGELYAPDIYYKKLSPPNHMNIVFVKKFFQNMNRDRLSFWRTGKSCVGYTARALLSITLHCGRSRWINLKDAQSFIRKRRRSGIIATRRLLPIRLFILSPAASDAVELDRQISFIPAYT